MRGGKEGRVCLRPRRTDSVVQFDAADGLLCCNRLAGSVSRSDFKESLVWIKKKMKMRLAPFLNFMNTGSICSLSRIVLHPRTHLVNSL